MIRNIPLHLFQPAPRRHVRLVNRQHLIVSRLRRPVIPNVPVPTRQSQQLPHFVHALGMPRRQRRIILIRILQIFLQRLRSLRRRIHPIRQRLIQQRRRLLILPTRRQRLRMPRRRITKPLRRRRPQFPHRRRPSRQRRHRFPKLLQGIPVIPRTHQRITLSHQLPCPRRLRLTPLHFRRRRWRSHQTPHHRPAPKHPRCKRKRQSRLRSAVPSVK